jgi:DDE superfamily endonuclease
VGPISNLMPYENDILQFCFALREQAIAVSVLTIVIFCRENVEGFDQKSRCAQFQSARRFMKAHEFVYRMGTHEAQQAPLATRQTALQFMEDVRSKIAYRNQDYVLNMDQTPVPFDFTSKKTLEMFGLKSINIRKSCSDTKRATCAITVTASGKFLKPMLIFKGKMSGRIVREFPTYADGIEYSLQDKACKRVMLEWVECVLKPYIADKPPDANPILFLDSYRCHMMESVVSAITELGVEVGHIPGGCTCLCQPVDVGINKPMKNRIRQHWEAWMVQEITELGRIQAPKRKQISEWVKSGISEITQQIIINSWRHDAFTWFLPQPLLPTEFGETMNLSGETMEGSGDLVIEHAHIFHSLNGGNGSDNDNDDENRHVDKSAAMSEVLDALSLEMQ